MKSKKVSINNLMVIISSFIFFASIVALIFGDWLAANIDVIGIRIAMLIVAFATFCSSSVFSLLILMHNRTVNKANDDANKRAELFRELSFASSNYSIIEFMDRMLIYDESTRYIEKYITKHNLDFHMIESQITENEVMEHPSDFAFISLKIPFRVVEGKMVSSIILERLKFKREGLTFEFVSPKSVKQSHAYILYNEQTKRNNVIINLIVPKASDFWLSSKINVFSKITINIEITSLLGVRVKGINELYFTNPEQIEGDGTNTYKINSSNFTLTEMPMLTELYKHNGN
jgi:hypothetical protein